MIIVRGLLMSYWNGILPMQTEHDAWLDMTLDEEREYHKEWEEPEEDSDEEDELEELDFD